MRFYVYNPKIWRNQGDAAFDGLAYERLPDGFIHEFIWQNDTQQWVDVDPNNDCDYFAGKEMLDVLVGALKTDVRYVLSLTDPSTTK